MRCVGAVLPSKQRPPQFAPDFPRLTYNLWGKGEGQAALLGPEASLAANDSCKPGQPHSSSGGLARIYEHLVPP